MAFILVPVVTRVQRWIGRVAAVILVVTLGFSSLGVAAWDLRGRLMGLIGHGHLAVTTRAFEEASQRVSRQLLMQALVNAIYGTCVALGLWALGVPYALFWGAIGAGLRFIPYVGPVVAAGAPVLVSLAVLPGWTRPLEVVGLFVALELFTNLVLETVLYADAAGVSQVAADLEPSSRPAPDATPDIRPVGDTTSEVHPSASISVLGYPVNGAADALCFADLPPSPSSRTRYLVKKLHAALPELTIVVGRWAPPPLEDDNPRLLTDAGATHVSSSLVDTRDVLRRLGGR